MRWVVDGKEFGSTYETTPEAGRYRSRRLVAKLDGERFSMITGEPESWAPADDEMKVFAWANKWVADEWNEWAPRTRASQTEALARFVPLVLAAKAPTAPKGLRAHVRQALRPEAEDMEPETAAWLDRWGLTLGQLDEGVLADVERRLGIGDKGQTLAPATAGRYRKVAHSCSRRAVELKKYFRALISINDRFLAH